MQYIWYISLIDIWQVFSQDSAEPRCKEWKCEESMSYAACVYWMYAGSFDPDAWHRSESRSIVNRRVVTRVAHAVSYPSRKTQAQINASSCTAEPKEAEKSFYELRGMSLAGTYRVTQKQ